MPNEILAVLVSNVTHSYHPFRAYADQECAFYGVTNPILLRLLLSHVSTGDYGCPRQLLLEVLRYLGPSLHQDEGEWGPLVVYAQTHIPVSPERFAFHEACASLEDDIVSI